MECGEIKLEKPLFYNNTFALRFEIGLAEISAWEDSKYRTLNKKYFDAALDRSLNIFDAIFASTDDISVAYQIFSDGRKRIKKKSFLFQANKRYQ